MTWYNVKGKWYAKDSKGKEYALENPSDRKILKILLEKDLEDLESWERGEW